MKQVLVLFLMTNFFFLFSDNPTPKESERRFLQNVQTKFKNYIDYAKKLADTNTIKEIQNIQRVIEIINIHITDKSDDSPFYNLLPKIINALERLDKKWSLADKYQFISSLDYDQLSASKKLKNEILNHEKNNISKNWLKKNKYLDDDYW